MPARSHRADEDLGVQEVVGQPDAVTEERALGEGARGVHGDDADRRVLGAHVANERTDEARLPDSGRPGDADPVRITGARIELADELVRERIRALDQRDGTGESAALAGADALDERFESPAAGQSRAGSGPDACRTETRPPSASTRRAS